MKHNLIKWSTVDWSKSSTALAKELGYCRDVISRKRREFAPDSVARVDWTKVEDWKLGNHDIAAALNAQRELMPKGKARPVTVTAAYVANARFRFGAGKANKRKPGSGLWKQTWRKEQKA